MKFHNKKIRRCSRSGGSNFNVHSFQRLEDRRLLATFTVTNTVDEVVMAAGDSPGSLRQAIFDANALAGADTITFDSSVFTGGDSSLIRLTSGELEITESLTIDASSGIDVTITGDANGDDVTLAGNITDVSASFGETEGAADDLLDDNSRVLNFSSTGDLTLESLTITGGHTRGRNADGGGIRTVNNISLINSTVSGNSSRGGSDGGGIYAQLGNVTLTNSTVSRNATTDDYSRGGGINARRGNVTLTNSTVSENSATSGGGIFASFGNMTLTGNVTLINSTVSGNLAQGFEGAGGGINARRVTLTDSTVSGNSNNNFLRPRGGGIFASDVTLTNSMVSENTVTAEYGSGGGIYSQDVTAINSTISGNSAFFGGGGIRSEGTLTLSNSTISGNSTLSGGGGGIGIVYANDSVVTVTNSTISGNSSSSRAGAIAFFEGGLLTVHNSIIAGNSARIGNNNFFGTDTFILENSIIDDTTDTTLTAGNGNQLDVDFATVLETEVVDGVTVPLLTDNGGPVETIALLAGSPAIDAGNNSLAVDSAGDPLATDQRGDDFGRFIDGDNNGAATVDIGAFEFGSSFLLGDVNQDGAVDFLDISPFIGVLAASGSQAEADVNQDGVVNFLDISPFIVLLSSQGSGSSAAFSASLEPANDEPVAQLSVSSSNSSRRISEGISVQLVQSPSEPLLSSSDVTGTELRAGISGPSPLAFVSGSQVQGADDDLRDLRIEPPVSNSDLAEVPNNTGNESSSQPDAFAIPANGPTSSSDLFDARPDLLDGLADPQLDDVLAGLLV